MEPLRVEAGRLVAGDGRVSGTVSENRIDLLGTEVVAAFASKSDPIDQLKSQMKSLLGVWYPRFVEIVSPGYVPMDVRKFRTKLASIIDERFSATDVTLQIGSGNVRFGERTINLDVFPFPEVDLVADCRKLPFADASIDGVINWAVLEHVDDPDALLVEAQRVLKPGGTIISGVPFLQGFHASPSDFQRWTAHGVEALHRKHGFTDVQIVPFAGPTSSLLWIAQEWLAMALSMGVRPLYYAWLPVLMVGTAPLKLLDAVMVHHPEAHRITSFFCCIARKA